MKFAIFAGTLLALSSLVTNAAAGYDQKIVKTIQSCATQYCGQKIQNIPTHIATVHKTTKVTVITTPKPSTCYITKKHQTKTVEKKITKTYTVAARCSTKTVYTTRFITSTRTVSGVRVVTSSVTVATITPDSTIVTAPPGFISVSFDPDNQYTVPENLKRDIKNHYPTAVKCTKTLQTVYKHTITAKRPKITVTKYGKTVTISYIKKVTKTAYGQKPKTVTITRVSTRTATTTKISTRTVTKSITATVPGITTYLGCGPGNFFLGPTLSVDVEVFPWDPQVLAMNAYECCAQCHAHLNAAGVSDCAGSFIATYPGSTIPICRFKLTNICSYSHVEKFVPKQGTIDSTGLVSNGPCGRWKVSLK
ncbi:hypothetical protein ABW20_dc0106759 [Dactylellina cionopaga]|nr:hypothetical protein ABW20_dc0106759 [Dactylellina cionopaga]